MDSKKNKLSGTDSENIYAPLNTHEDSKTILAVNSRISNLEINLSSGNKAVDSMLVDSKNFSSENKVVDSKLLILSISHTEIPKYVDS